MSLLPINAAAGGLSTLLPLYILNLGGSVIDVSFANAAYNFALIPSSLIWGYVIDRLSGRRRLMLGTTIVPLLVIVAMYFAASIPALVLLYGFFSFFLTALAPLTPLLIMELHAKHEWAHTFGTVGAVSTFGLVLGVAPGVFWTLYLPLHTYIVYCAILQLLAIILVAKLVPEPKQVVEREAIAFSADALAQRIRELPLIFFRIPRVNDFRRFYRMIQLSLTQTVPLIIVSMTLFFTSASVFFTSYTPFMKSRMVQDFEVFAVFLTLFLTNAILFFYAGGISSRFGAPRTAAAAMLLRGIAMLSSLVLLLLGGSLELVIASVIILAVFGLSYTFANTSTSVILFGSLQPGKQGEVLGIYSALTGVGLLLGAFASGIISITLGYGYTFITAATVVLLSYVLFIRSGIRDH